MKTKMQHDGFRFLDRGYLRKAALYMSDHAFQKLAVELGIEADSETVSFMRQAFTQVANDSRMEDVADQNKRLMKQVEERS